MIARDVAFQDILCASELFGVDRWILPQGRFASEMLCEGSGVLEGVRTPRWGSLVRGEVPGRGLAPVPRVEAEARGSA